MPQEILKGARFLVVDDEEIIRDFFTEALGRAEAEVVTCNDGAEAIERLGEEKFDVVITDLRMPNVDGMELLRHIIGNHPAVPVIILTAYASVENAVEAMQIGAWDYVCKPVTDLGQLDLTLERAMRHRRLHVENLWLKNELSNLYKFDQLVGTSPQMRRIFELLETVAPTPTTVLIVGESGTGKELVARAIHHNSQRGRAPFVKVNCAAMPEGLIESELFGHERGAFTGAVRTTRGKFEAAHGGTLLLDEIGELPLNLQAKLLRVLQEREFQRVGSTETVKVDVRLVATTNVDLEKAVAEGKFRRDLYYRLNVIPIEIPPLREHPEDIPVLAHHFLRRFAKLHGRKMERISAEAMRHLTGNRWEGNVRELENAIERALVFCKGEQIELTDFFVTKLPPEPSPQETTPQMQVSLPIQGSAAMTIAELEKLHIMNTLRAESGHRARTAEKLGISIRTLRNKLNEYRAAGEAV